MLKVKSPGMRLEGWRVGWLEDWRIGGLEGWRIGGLEGWRVGGLEGWRVGGLEGVDLKLGRETLSLAFSGSGMRQAFRWRPAFTKALTASATI